MNENYRYTQIDGVDQIVRYFVINIDETLVVLLFADIQRGYM